VGGRKELVHDGASLASGSDARSSVSMATIESVRDLAGRDQGLAVVVTQRADGSPQTSIANAGVLAHPVSGGPVVGLVVQGDTRKHANLRRRPRATVVFRVGWEWVAVEGPVDLAGPRDPLDGLEPGRGPHGPCDVCSCG